MILIHGTVVINKGFDDFLACRLNNNNEINKIQNTALTVSFQRLIHLNEDHLRLNFFVDLTLLRSRGDS